MFVQTLGQRRIPKPGSRYKLKPYYRLEFDSGPKVRICRKVRRGLGAVVGWAGTLTLANTLLEAKLVFLARERFDRR